MNQFSKMLPGVKTLLAENEKLTGAHKQTADELKALKDGRDAKMAKIDEAVNQEIKKADVAAAELKIELGKRRKKLLDVINEQYDLEMEMIDAFHGDTTAKIKEIRNRALDALNTNVEMDTPPRTKKKEEGENPALS